MSSGYGPFDLKTKPGRMILRDKLSKKYLMATEVRWRTIIFQTLFCLHIKRSCGNYHNILNRKHWECACK